MSKHTPGEWKVRFMGGPDDGENDFFVEAKNNNKPELGYGIEILGDDYGDHNGYPREQRLADAQLIACAPEMLEALKEVWTTYQYDLNVADEGSLANITLIKVKNAIAKAEGGNP